MTACICFVIGDVCAVLLKARTWLAVLVGLLLFTMAVTWLSVYARSAAKKWAQVFQALPWLHHCHVPRQWIWIPFLIYAGYFCCVQNNHPSILESDGQKKVSAQIYGTIYKIQEKSSYYQFYLKENNVAIAGENFEVQGILVRLEVQKLFDMPQIGDSVEVHGTLEEFSKPMNTGEFDTRSYYRSMNIMYLCKASKVGIQQRESSAVLRGIHQFREQLKASFQRIATEQDAGILISVVLGDKSELDLEINQLYQRNGIAHLLAISGLHVSIIGMSCYRLLRRMGASFGKAALISGVLILGYGMMTGNAVSTVRAMIMFLVSVFAQVLGRTYDILSAMSLAGLLILTDMPLMITNCGFLLSFGAVFGIAWMAPALTGILPDCIQGKELWHRIVKWFLAGLTGSIAVNLITLPVLLYFYSEVPIYAVLLNVFVIPLMSLVMVGAVLGGICGIFWQTGGTFFIGIAHYILWFYEKLCLFAAQIPGNQQILGRPQPYQIVLYYVLLLGVFALSKKMLGEAHSALKQFCVLCFAVLLLVRRPSGMEVHLMYVGQGDGIFVKAPNGQNYLIDGGSTDKKEVGKYTMEPCLKANAVRKIDCAFISHMDRDHTSGILYLLENQETTGITIAKLALPDIGLKDEAYRELMELAVQSGVEVCYFAAGQQWQAREVTFSCLYPEKGVYPSSRNAGSMVLHMNYGKFDLLLTGDLEAEGEQWLTGSGLLQRAEVLKVAHHGSGNSTGSEFLQQVCPATAVISCGIDNSYGHPHKNLLSRLERAGSEIVDMRGTGEVTIRTNGAEYTLNFWK